MKAKSGILFLQSTLKGGTSNNRDKNITCGDTASTMSIFT
jgi:hypothetical protein